VMLVGRHKISHRCQWGTLHNSMQGFTNILKWKNGGSSFCKIIGSMLLMGANYYFLEIVGLKSCGEQ
jgi:hypothetical protein